jgi:hypothetical protein
MFYFGVVDRDVKDSSLIGGLLSSAATRFSYIDVFDIS